MKYAAEMGSSAKIYIPSFMKIGSGIRMFIEGIHRQADRMPAFMFSKQGK
jgi:hypothetical protein